MALKVWNWNDFSGGLADNPFVGQKGQFQNGSYNIEVQTEPGIVKLTPKLELYLTTTDTPKYILNLKEYGESGLLVFCNDGKIYKDGNPTPIYTMINTPNDMHGVTAQYDSLGDLYIYWATHGYIHKANITFTTVLENYKTIESQGYKKNMINVYGTIYFSSKNIFYKLDKNGILSTIYTLPKEDIITGITFFQDNFYIYTRNDISIDSINGRQYIFSVTKTNIDSEPTYNTLWKGLSPMGITNVGGTDYVITGLNEFSSDLYITGGTQRKLLKSNPEGSSYRTFNDAITSRIDDVYIGGMNGDNIGMFKYGSYYPGQTPVLQQITRTNDDVSCIYADTNYLYIGTNDDEVYKYSLGSEPTYADDGYIASLETDLGNPFDKKSIQQINIAYDCKDNALSKKSGTITLYASIDGGSYSTVKSQEIVNSVGVIEIFGNELLTYGGGVGMSNFSKISFKVKLQPYNSGSGNLDTPGFKGLQVIYEDGVRI